MTYKVKYVLIIYFILLFLNYQANSWPIFSAKETIRITDMEEVSISNQIFYHFNLQLQTMASPKTLIADFSSSAVEICPNQYINFYDNSTGNVIGWEWYFEGGIPVNSAEQNPVIYYPDSGIFDVSLVVSDGITTDTLYIENFMYVIEFPEVTFSELPEFCLNDTVYDLTEGSPQGGDYSGPGVFFGHFVPGLAGIGTHTLSYFYHDENGCSDTATQVAIVSACTGTNEILNNFQINIIPNPAKNYCWLELQLSDLKNLRIEMIDHVGKIINTLTGSHFQSPGLKERINLQSIKPGLYFLRVIYHDKVMTINKLVVYK